MQSKLSSEQEQVWSMEDEYWRVLSGLDRDGYIALWDENFVGWPYPVPDPVRKDAVRSNPFGLLKDRKLEKVQLERKAIQAFGGLAVVYYIVTGTYVEKDGSAKVERLRITHTWRKTGGTWLIISGMSAPA